MGGTIKRIDSIKNIAVFQNFQWAASVRDKGNKIAEFKKINIFYGRNYSGKTTLSRIFRSLETGSISDRYDLPEFVLSFDDSSEINQNSLNNHGHTVRVFNEDFIKDNLCFIVDEQQTINSFAILGEDNTVIEKEIKKCEAELGSEENKTGLLGELLAATEKFKKIKENHDTRLEEMEEKLRKKANNPNTGIKHNKLFGDANYNINRIKEDINIVLKDDYIPLICEKINEFHKILKEEPKPEIPELSSFNFQYSAIASKAKELIEKEVQSSELIQELFNDSELAIWVKDGRKHHEGKRNKCVFCGGDLDSKIWEKLDKHFNRESEELLQELEALKARLEEERQRVSNLLQITNSDFYSNFAERLNELKNIFLTQIKLYCENLNFIKEQIEKRKQEIFTAFSFDACSSNEDVLNEVEDSFEKIRKESNGLTMCLFEKQSNARTALRLNEVYEFINDIQYENELNEINKLKESMERAEIEQDMVQQKVNTKQDNISHLKAQLRDESRGAERVNNYLNNFFGHQFLSLKVIEESTEDSLSGYRFEVTRNDEKAFHLSEGECSLIAFCYFIAKLEDIETKGNQPIIWIDDPISSLDANHIFFIFSLINTKIVRPENSEDANETRNCEPFKQLFISTHNLDFLKYLKRLHGALDKKKSQYFIINRTNQVSEIKLMPQYLKDYVTEFNFLFHQIYKCAFGELELDENHDYYYNFGNNTRKFLEAFLYYKYPNARDNDNKLKRFFGDENALAASLTDRINNEFSHLAGVFERSIQPIDIPEMKTVAKFILQKIEEKDPEQYEALLQSIGEANAQQDVSPDTSDGHQ